MKTFIFSLIYTDSSFNIRNEVGIIQGNSLQEVLDHLENSRKKALWNGPTIHISEFDIKKLYKNVKRIQNEY